MKFRTVFSVIAICMLFFTMLPTRAIAPIEPYNILFNGSPDVEILPVNSSQQVLNIRYVSVYEFEGFGDSHIIKPHYMLSGSKYSESSTYISPKASSQNFSMILDNGANITFICKKYNMWQNIDIDGRIFPVFPGLFHVRYTIDNWPVTKNKTNFGIQTYSDANAIIYEITKTEQSWAIDTPAMHVNASIIAQSNENDTIFGKTWSTPLDDNITNKSFYQGDGHHGTTIFSNFGIGLLGGNHTSTDVFYDITVKKSGTFLNIGSFIVAFLILPGTIVAGTKFLFRKRKVSSVSVQTETVSELFQSRSVLYYYFLGTVNIKNKEIDDQLREAIPKDLYSFKFLLNPVRLSIIKLLYENLEMSSIELKEILDIDWNTFNTHLTALKKREYVSSEHSIFEGERRLMISILPLGIDQFKILTDLLHLFLDSTADIDLSDITSDADDVLFPKK